MSLFPQQSIFGSPTPACEFSPEEQERCRHLLYLGWTNEEIATHLNAWFRWEAGCGEDLVRFILGQMMDHLQRPVAQQRAIAVDMYRQLLLTSGNKTLQIRILRRLEQLLDVQPSRRRSEPAVDEVADENEVAAEDNKTNEHNDRPPPKSPPPPRPRDTTRQSQPKTTPSSVAEWVRKKTAENLAKSTGDSDFDQAADNSDSDSIAHCQSQPPDTWWRDIFAVVIVLLLCFRARLQGLRTGSLRWPRLPLPTFCRLHAWWIWCRVTHRRLTAPFP